MAYFEQKSFLCLCLMHLLPGLFYADILQESIPSRALITDHPSHVEKDSTTPIAYGISSRTDRYGGNGTLWAISMLFAHYTKKPLYHLCTKQCLARWGETVYHQILLDYCEKVMPPIGTELLYHRNWFAIPQKCMELVRTDIPTALKKSGLAAKWFAYFEQQAQKEGWHLKWTPKHTIVIHVRLDDCAPRQNHDLRLVRGGDGKQGYIGDANLKTLITKLHAVFPEKNIHIVTSPLERDLERCKGVVQDFSYVKGVWGDENKDYALWQMMCSDILVLSRSTFSMLAGFLHQGSRCFTYENWKVLECLQGGYKGQWEDFSSYVSKGEMRKAISRASKRG